MRKILVPVDGSSEALEAVKQAIREAKSPVPAEIHLLNVQARTIPEESMIAVPVEDMDTYYYQRSTDALAAAERALRDEGVAFVSHREMGPVAERILEKQRELDCSLILMGTQGHGRLMGKLLGSVSSRVQSMAKVPVTLVKSVRVPDFTGRLGAT